MSPVECITRDIPPLRPSAMFATRKILIYLLPAENRQAINRFDNPEAILLPGMYVRALVTQAQRPKAILAPQAGIARDPKGNATALVVGPNDQVALRQVRTSRVVRDRWLVEEGLAPGDRLIVEGTGKVKPGQRVKPVPAGQPSVAPPPSPSASR